MRTQFPLYPLNQRNQGYDYTDGENIVQTVTVIQPLDKPHKENLPECGL